MPLSRFLELLRYIAIPAIMGICMLCLLLTLGAFALTPEGLNPAEAVVIRLYLLQHDNELNTPSGTDPNLQRFVVEENDSANSIGIKLVTQGFINNGTLFQRYVQYEGLDTELRAGTFFISSSMTIPQIAAKLTDPVPSSVRVVVIEGWRMEQIADEINRQELLAFTGNDFLALVSTGAPLPPEFQGRYGIPAGASLEGFLFPATYDVPVEATALDFRDMLLEAFDANVNATLQRDATAAGWTMHEVVTMASIVEREAVLPSERPQIASVYFNRLDAGMPLQADPTTQYGIGNTRDGNWWPQITQDDYQNNHPYNTYVISGLPPGPIAAPSISSIRSVIYPANTPFIYFRAACDGSGAHQFSVTFEEHLEKGC